MLCCTCKPRGGLLDCSSAYQQAMLLCCIVSELSAQAPICLPFPCAMYSRGFCSELLHKLVHHSAHSMTGLKGSSQSANAWAQTSNISFC